MGPAKLLCLPFQNQVRQVTSGGAEAGLAQHESPAASGCWKEHTCEDLVTREPWQRLVCEAPIFSGACFGGTNLPMCLCVGRLYLMGLPIQHPFPEAAEFCGVNPGVGWA